MLFQFQSEQITKKFFRHHPVLDRAAALALICAYLAKEGVRRTTNLFRVEPHDWVGSLQLPHHFPGKPGNRLLAESVGHTQYKTSPRR